MAMGQRRWRSIDRLQLGNGNGATVCNWAMAMGQQEQLQWHWGTGELGQLQ
jgi:hypothetical protein